MKAGTSAGLSSSLHMAVISGLKLLRVMVFVAGIAASIAFFFSFIGLLLGAVFFFSFKGVWRLNGFMLALTAALASNAPLRGLSEITGIYPLFLVTYLVTGILGIYFLLLLAFSFLSGRAGALQECREKFKQQFGGAFGTLKPFVKFALILVMLLTAGLWASVNVDLAVMLDNKPALLWVHAPSTVAPGEEFAVQVQCWDQFERVSALYDGTVRFSLESYDPGSQEPLPETAADLPGAYTFTASSRPSAAAYMLDNGKDNGRRSFPVTIHTPGLHYLKVTDAHTGRTWYSNPILVQDTSRRIYWGDIHTHGIYSDGSGTPAHQFYYARHVAMLDFFALTEHGEIIQLGKDRLSRYTEQVNAANSPGEFVTLLGLEYTNHQTGHYTCIFDGDRLPAATLLHAPYPGIGAGLRTPNELWRVLDDFTRATGARALALPHHTVKASFLQDWTYFNPQYVRIAEVTSVHGDSLYEPDHPLSYRGATSPPPAGTTGCSITGALTMGLPLGLYASSDGHDGHPGHALSHTRATVGHQWPFTFWWTRFDLPYPGGLTAVYAEDLSRRSIFNALYDRCTYAVADHGRPIIEFTVNGTGVGGDSTVAVAEARDPREIRVMLAQDGATAADRHTSAAANAGSSPDWNATVEIHKNGALLAALPVSQPFAVVNYTDTEPVTGTAYGPDKCVLKDGRYFVNEFSDNPVDPAALNTAGKDFYLIRVVGANGRHIYAGPIWVKNLGTH